MGLYLIILNIICSFCMCNSDNSDNNDTNNFPGDSCQINTSGLNGICRPIEECPSAKESLMKDEDIRPLICGFEDTNALICCADGDDDIPSVRKLPLQYETVITDEEPSEVLPYLSTEKCMEYRNRVYPNFECPQFLDDVKEYSKVPAEKYPYFAYIGYSYENKTMWACYGELLSEFYVLTRGTCLYSLQYGYAKFVRLGGNLTIPSDFDEDQVQLINVAELIKYPRYRHRGHEHNIALIKLEKPAILNRFVLPACLPTSRNFRNILIATDWKYLYKEGAYNDTDLREVTVEEVSTKECKDVYGMVKYIHVCASLRERVEGQCAAKGALIEPYDDIKCMYTVIAFEISSKGCEAGLLPVLYCRINPYLPWIEKHVWGDEVK